MTILRSDLLDVVQQRLDARAREQSGNLEQGEDEDEDEDEEEQKGQDLTRLWQGSLEVTTVSSMESTLKEAIKTSTGLVEEEEEDESGGGEDSKKGGGKEKSKSWSSGKSEKKRAGKLPLTTRGEERRRRGDKGETAWEGSRVKSRQGWRRGEKSGRDERKKEGRRGVGRSFAVMIATGIGHLASNSRRLRLRTFLISKDLVLSAWSDSFVSSSLSNSSAVVSSSLSNSSAVVSNQSAKISRSNSLLSTYAILCFVAIFCQLVRSLSLALACTNASQSLHDRMLEKVLGRTRTRTRTRTRR
eukprot:766363-Hanusia_phi.AAC.1